MGEALAIAEQPVLFTADAYPERPDIVELVRSRSFIVDKPPKKVFAHTGKILLRKLKADPETCEALCWAIAVGLSAREIARRFGISPRSVLAVREAMTARGELASVAKRIDGLLNAFVEVGYERVLEGTLNGEIHPGQLPIPVLAADDKRRQRDAGMVVGTERTVAAVTAEQIILEQEVTRRELLASSEVVSVVPAQITEGISPVTGLDTGSDTGSATSDAHSNGRANHDSVSDNGGAGVAVAPAGGNGEGMGGENSGT